MCMCVLVCVCVHVYVCVYVCVSRYVHTYMCDHSYLLHNVVDHFILHRVQCWAYELNGTVILILTTINANHDTLPVDWTTAMLQYPQDSISGAVTSAEPVSTCQLATGLPTLG